MGKNTLVSSEEQESRKRKGNMGFWLSPRLKALVDKPGYLGSDQAQELRNLYVDESANQEPLLASDFAQLCYFGRVAVESGQGPDIEGTESPLRLSYLTLVILGSTRVSGTIGTDSLQHAATLEYLISVGAPLDLGDVVGYSPLFHSMIGTPNLALARILLKAGASANHRNKYGESPLLPVMMQGHPESLDLLMEFDANLDTADSDGIVPRHFAVKAGPQIVAIVGKWERKRAGITDAPLESSQRCKTCGKSKADGVSLNLCASCKLVKYCSKDCQKRDWRVHKLSCRPSDISPTVVVTPTYMQDSGLHMGLLSLSDLTRSSMQGPASNRADPATRISPDTAQKKHAENMIIKVQLPVAMDSFGNRTPSSMGNMLVYNRKRTFTAVIASPGNEQAYGMLQAIIREKGVKSSEHGLGLKAYFQADLESREKLVIRMEVLAEQPF